MRRLAAACWLAGLSAAQDDGIEVEIEITGALGMQDSASAIYSRLLDAVSVDPSSGVAPIDTHTTLLQGIQADAMVVTKDENSFIAGIDVLSESGVRAEALEGFEVTSGAGLAVRVQEVADLTAGAVDLGSLGEVTMVAGDDASVSIGGDIGAVAGGSVSFSADDVTTSLEGSASLSALGEMRVEAGGQTSLAAQSLLANIGGDVGILGRALLISGSKELSVVAAEVDVQTPGSIRVAGNGGIAEVDGEARINFIGFMWRSNANFDHFENVLPEPVSEVTQIVVRASSQGGAAVVTGSGTTVMMHLGEDDGTGGTAFGKVWTSKTGSGEYSMDGLTITLDRLYAVSVIRLGSTGGSGETFRGWSEVEFLLGQHVAAGTMRVASASNLEATAVGGVILGANAVHVSSATELVVDATNTQLLSSEISIRVTDELAAKAKTVSLEVSDTVDVFAGGALSGSFASVEAESRGPASLTAAGAIDIAGESAGMVLSGKLDVTVDRFELRTDEATISAQNLDAVASESASLHTVDASLSASGRLDAYMAAGDLVAEGDIAVRSGGDLSAVSQDILLLTETAHLHTKGQVQAAVGTLNLDADDVDVASDGAIRAAAGGDMDITIGESLNVGVEGSADVIVGSLDVQSLDKVGLIAGDDTELLVGGDLGATTTGDVTLDTAKLTTRVTGATDLVTGDDISIAAGGDASLAAESLAASVKGDIDVLGSAFHLSGTKELSVVASEVDVQTPGHIRIAGEGGTAELSQEVGMRVASASDLEASATGELLLAAGGAVQLSSGGELDVSAETASLLTNELSVRAEQGMDAQAKALNLQVSEGIDTFSGGGLSGSFASVQAESRAGAELAAAGPVAVAAESATLVVSDDLEASATNMKLHMDTASVSMADATATVAEKATLSATDASLSLSGQLDAYMNSGDILADGNLGVRSSGDLKAQANGVQLEATDGTQLTTGTMDALVGSMKFHATETTQSGRSRKVKVPLNCATLPGGSCAGISDADAPAMRAELAALLGVDQSRLNIKVRDIDPNSAAAAGRRQLSTVPDKPVDEWTVDELTLYIGKELRMEQLAGAVKSEGVDGGMAVEMIRPDWQELGASGLKASRVISALRRLQKHEGDGV